MEREIPTHAAKAVIRNQNGDILFVRRSSNRGVVSNWDLPGGLVEDGESDEQALGREILEELSIGAVVGRKVGEWSFHRPLDGKRVEVTNYEAELESTEFKLSDEHDESKWVPPAQIQELQVKDPSIFSAIN